MSRNKFKFHVIYLWRNLYSGHRIIFITHHLCLNMTRPVISVRNVFWIYYNISFILKKIKIKAYICAIEEVGGGIKNHAIDSSYYKSKHFSEKYQPQAHKTSTVRESWKEILYIPDRKFRKEPYISIYVFTVALRFFSGSVKKESFEFWKYRCYFLLLCSVGWCV